MRFFLAVVVTCIMQTFAVAQVRPLDLGAYQGQDGAITLSPNGTQIEPYFATKALLVAQDAGLETHEAAVKWIGWVLAHQRPDGRIDRWCKKGTAEWQRCADADADDSMLSMWTQLLYRNSGDAGLPLEWQRSADLAFAYLKTLKNRWGVYYPSHKNHTPLFMDNVEIYSSFKDIGTRISRWDLGGAAAMNAQSQELANDIQCVFWSDAEGRFRPSVQKIRPAFYPDAVGQTYPWLEGMPTMQDPQQSWESWKQRYASGWLKREFDPHPWGLVALAALKLNDSATAGCWFQKSASQRGNGNWNVLEEASFQVVQSKSKSGDPNICSELVSGND